MRVSSIEELRWCLNVTILGMTGSRWRMFLFWDMRFCLNWIFQRDKPTFHCSNIPIYQCRIISDRTAHRVLLWDVVSWVLGWMSSRHERFCRSNMVPRFPQMLHYIEPFIKPRQKHRNTFFRRHSSHAREVLHRLFDLIIASGSWLEHSWSSEVRIVIRCPFWWGGSPILARCCSGDESREEPTVGIFSGDLVRLDSGKVLQWLE